MDRRQALRAGWLSAQAALAVWFLLSTAADRDVVFLVVMALSFPAGLLPPLAVAPIAALISMTGIDLWLLANIVIWAGSVAVGYWQWFVLLPRLRPGRHKEADVPIQ